jgi:hypothetical protein
MPITTPNLKIGCLVCEEQRRDFVEAMEGNSGDVRSWSQIRGAVHSSCLGHAQRRWAERSAVLGQGLVLPTVRQWKAIVETSAGHKSGALFTHLALVTKKVSGEIGRDSNPMAERSATVTRRVQPARGKGFCEAEKSNANNDVKPEVLPYLDICVEGCSGRGRSGAEGKRPRAMVCGREQGALQVACGGEAAMVASCC